MKHLLEGFLTAFSLYSAIPVPAFKWDRESMRYALCFFPLIGAVTGFLLMGWGWACFHFGASPILFASVGVLLPILVSGGIHMDGFIDTMDALSAHAPSERRLEILADPHVGAFGVLACVCLLLLQLGLWCQVYETSFLWPLPLAGFVLSRALNALSIAVFPCAKTSGLVHTFSSAAARRAVVIVCLLYVLIAMVLCIVISPLWGGALLVASLFYFAWHRRFCMNKFGGNTGDLAGFLLQNVELIALAAAAIGGVLG